MPPRRSCFHLNKRHTTHKISGFNATTAFLLPRPPFPVLWVVPRFQCHHGVPASGRTTTSSWRTSTVSMPPRRSCFPGTACCEIHPRARFNATTAFLLRICRVPEISSVISFQCHHGVPASLLYHRVVDFCQVRDGTSQGFPVFHGCGPMSKIKPRSALALRALKPSTTNR